MRKRIISLLLAVVLVFSAIPGSAMAAVRDLMENSATENQTILDELNALTGTSDTTLSPGSCATRAQVAAILMRFCQALPSDT